MKINRSSRITSTNTPEVKKSHRDETFRTLLSNRLEEAAVISDHAHDQPPTISPQSRELISQAADLLDGALQKIKAGEELGSELSHQLSKIRQSLQRGEEMREVDTLLAVEAKRIGLL